MNKKEFLKLAKRQYQISKSGLAKQHRHIKECQAFYAGDYMNYKDKISFTGNGGGMRGVEFNRVKPYVNAIVGFMIGQRRKPDYQAKVKDSFERQMYSDYQNALSDYVRKNTHADQVETRQDMDMVIGGIGCTDTGLTLNGGEATRDPNGEIIVERVSPLECGYDPNSIAQNVLDSKWVYRVKDYDIEEAEELFDAEEDDFEIVNSDDDVDYQFNPLGGIQDKVGFEYSSADRTMVRVYFHQLFKVENFYRVDNPLLEIDDPELQSALAQALVMVEPNPDDELFEFDPAAKTLILTKANKNQIRDIFKMFELPFEPITEKRKVYYTGIYSGDKVFRVFKSPSQQGFSLKFKTGDRDEVNHIWTGIVASMRDPVRYYNKALTEMMLIIASNSRGGVMYEEDAIENIQEFEAKWAKSNSAIKVNNGALSQGKIQPKATPSMANGYENIISITDGAMGQVTGIDESFFGAQASGNETAMLQRQRLTQATTTLATYFDSIALYGIEQARMMLSFMRLLVQASDGKLFKALGDDGQVIFETMSQEFFVDEYEVDIGEAPETPVQKEFYVQTLIGAAQSMLAVGDQRYREMYAAAVDYMPFNTRDKIAIKKILLGDAPIDPALVEQLQAQIQALQAPPAQLELAKKTTEIEKLKSEIRQKQIENNKILAEIRETEEDIEGKAIENDYASGFLGTSPNAKVNVSI